MFKEGEYVICNTNDYNKNIVYGKKYKILTVFYDLNCIRIVSEKNRIISCRTNWFLSVQDFNLKIREQKIKKLIENNNLKKILLNTLNDKNVVEMLLNNLNKNNYKIIKENGKDCDNM